jgi:uracil-DNA glycosylase
MENITDKPKSLKDPLEKEHRLSLIYEKHIAPLTEFVHQMRIDKGNQYQIPYFDPLDGGINSSMLFLLEAPGPNAVKSGFISRNNPDETAKNIFQILIEIGIPRSKTTLWNIVPWYIGNGQKIRPANTQDIFQGWSYFTKLMQLLPNVDTVVLVGIKAQKIQHRVNEKYKEIKTIECYHPSPMFINHNIDNKKKIMEQLRVLKK